MKAPVGLLSGRAVCVSRWRGFAPTSSADAPLSHFHGWGRNGKRHLQRLLPAEAAALRRIPLQALRASSPKGEPFVAAANFPALLKPSPWGRWLDAQRQDGRGWSSPITQQSRPVVAGRLCCAYWKGSIGRWQLLCFAGRGFFSRARTRMTDAPGTRLTGRNDAFSPYQEGRFCVMLSVPRFARFGRFSARIDPQMR